MNKIFSPKQINRAVEESNQEAKILKESSFQKILQRIKFKKFLQNLWQKIKARNFFSKKMQKTLVEILAFKYQKITKKQFGIVSVALFVLIFGAFQIFGISKIKSATFGWLQTDWSGGADTNAVATHTSNQSGWTKFFSKDANVDTSGGEAKLTGSSAQWVDTSDTDFNAGSKTNTYVSGTGNAATFAMLKQNGGACSLYTECASGFCLGGLCTARAGYWLTGACTSTLDNVGATLQVYRQDQGTTLAWKTANTNCDTPQCGIMGGQDGDNLVADNAVDFSAYPARNACKALGGRLPTKTELSCIYTNRNSYNTFQAFQLNNYWSASELSTDLAWNIYFYSGSATNGSKASTNYVRCVRGQ
jgi:hypothetical protein